jgi:SAM-dependent methyltransferase
MDNWPCNYTYPDRYYEWGIAQSIMEFCRVTGKNQLYIVDVGCSTGEATHNLKARLLQAGIGCYTKGIDVDPVVKDIATINLDEFELGDITQINISQAIANVVICNSIAIYVTAEHRARIIAACSNLIKNDGALVTNADCFEPPPGIFDEIKTTAYLFAGIFRREYKYRSIQVRKRKLRVLIGPNQCLQYPNQIMDGWNKLNSFGKLNWKIELGVRKLSARIRKPFFNRKVHAKSVVARSKLE